MASSDFLTAWSQALGEAGASWTVPEQHWSRELAQAEQQHLVQAGQVRLLGHRDWLFRYGDPVEACFFVVLEGRLKLSMPDAPGGERTTGLVGPGDLFGADSCAGLRGYTHEAVCLTSSARVIAVSSARFEEAVRQAPQLALALSRALAQETRRAREMSEATSLPAEVRVAHLLLTLTHRFGEPLQNGTVRVVLNLRHDELASLAGTTRVSATQAFRRLRDAKAVTGTRGVYEVQPLTLQAWIAAGAADQ
ncbi:Crp/Fnr family transcriptional regulator [Deinococcus radiopugnans]|nr:Crp/Fnr family transcriptional regulator [Deinococcus radiopugnans]MBB6015978.1 CRP/FNR family transcriptional regulator [Deinococcus radiopugnans ATCC 19172]